MRSSAFPRAIWATVLSTALALVAMVRYPGGTKFDATTHGYAWSQNFLSDLGMTIAYDGRSNSVGALCFVAALATLIVGLGGALLAFLRRYATNARARRLAWTAGVFGVATCLAFVGVALTPEDRAMQLHVLFTRVAFDLLPGAPLFLALAARTSEGTSGTAVALWGVLSAALLAYSALLTWGPEIDTPERLMIYVLAQKAIVVVLGGVALYQCVAAEGTITPRR